MKNRLPQILLTLLAFPCASWAADPAVISPSGGVLKMVLGLATVLAVMALITWVLKRMVPSVTNRQSLVRVVGGVSVGSRERVVLLEVAGRLLVVGVAPGRVSQLADLEMDATQLAESALNASNPMASVTGNISNNFAQWLTKSTDSILKKNDQH